MRPTLRRRGFTLIELLIVISIILVILAITIPNMHTHMEAAHEMAVIGEIRTIHQAQAQYRSQFGRYAATLDQLGPPISGADGQEAANIIPQTLAAGKKNGFLYSLATTSVGYAVTAVPESFNNSGRRTFYSDQTMVVRNNWGPEPATPPARRSSRRPDP